jgi:hypothetical protein
MKPNFLSKYYKSVTTKCSDHLSNVISMRSLKFSKLWGSLGKKSKKDEW